MSPGHLLSSRSDFAAKLQSGTYRALCSTKMDQIQYIRSDKDLVIAQNQLILFVYQEMPPSDLELKSHPASANY